MGNIDAGAPPERKLSDKEYLARAADERRSAISAVLNDMFIIRNDSSGFSIRFASTAEELDMVANSLDHYIARSSQGWVR